MFGGKDMAQMMKQMGVDMDELDADKVEIHIGDQKLVFSNPSVSKIDAKGNEIFQLQGNYSKEAKDSEPEVAEEDIELVVEKTGASEEESREALKDAEEPADAIMELQ
jgi:nascent polypeptide-associated complex subunit alpha